MAKKKNTDISEIAEKEFGEKRSLRITGMTCATCAKNVERALSKIEGVKFAAVNLATDTAFVVLEKDVPHERSWGLLKRASAGSPICF